MEKDLANWEGCSPPPRKTLNGKYIRLEPLNPTKHGDDLYEFHHGDGAEERMKYLWEVPTSRENFQKWLKSTENLDDPIFFAVIDKKTGKAGGRQSFLRIDAPHGVLELGHILWGPLIAKTRNATESVYLVCCYVFEELGYRRLEWKCHNGNVPSKKAAIRFGFKLEGIFRQHMIMKGENRDTAWFAIIDKEWPSLKKGYEKWLREDNFDDNGLQKEKLEYFLNLENAL